MPIKVNISPSTRKDKKYDAFWIKYTPTGTIKEKGKVSFGQKGASDYTKHKDRQRKKWYLERHGGIGPGYTKSTKENWGKTGYKSQGFWSRWYSWNTENIGEAKKDIKRRFDIDVE